MAADPVTPIPGINTSVPVGGVPVIVVAPLPNGGFITNPASGADQNIGGGVESLYVDAVNPAQLGAFGTTFEIPPGGTWTLIPGQSTNTTINAATGGHRFSVTSF